MTESYLALYVHPAFGHLQLHFSDGVLVQLDLPHQPLLQDAYNALPNPWQQQLDAYFQGELTDFGVAISPTGTAHDAKVWQAMLAIPYGKTRNYGDVAAEIGSSAQAVGNACGRNPLPIVVPCHRIVGRHGLGGFSGSNDVSTTATKHWLLEHERTHAR